MLIVAYHNQKLKFIHLDYLSHWDGHLNIGVILFNFMTRKNYLNAFKKSYAATRNIIF